MIEDGSLALRLLHDPFVQRIAEEYAERGVSARALMTRPGSGVPALSVAETVLDRYAALGGEPPARRHEVAAAVVSLRQRLDQQ